MLHVTSHLVMLFWKNHLYDIRHSLGSIILLGFIQLSYWESECEAPVYGDDMVGYVVSYTLPPFVFIVCLVSFLWNFLFLLLQLKSFIYFLAESNYAACRSFCWWSDWSLARALTVWSSRTVQSQGSFRAPIFHKRTKKVWVSFVMWVHHKQSYEQGATIKWRLTYNSYHIV